MSTMLFITSYAKFDGITKKCPHTHRVDRPQEWEECHILRPKMKRKSEVAVVAWWCEVGRRAHENKRQQKHDIKNEQEERLHAQILGFLCRTQSAQMKGGHEYSILNDWWSFPLMFLIPESFSFLFFLSTGSEEEHLLLPYCHILALTWSRRIGVILQREHSIEISWDAQPFFSCHHRSSWTDFIETDHAVK